jgi:hypothetical protein
MVHEFPGGTTITLARYPDHWVVKIDQSSGDGPDIPQHPAASLEEALAWILRERPRL